MSILRQSIECPHCGDTISPDMLPSDGRATLWRVRVRLYNERNMDDAAADSDPERQPDAPGEIVLAGLPAVADYLAELATFYHGTTSDDLDGDVLRHRLKALRPTLSRRGGNAVWRVPYHINGAGWLARVDIQKEEKVT